MLTPDTPAGSPAQPRAIPGREALELLAMEEMVRPGEAPEPFDAQHAMARAATACIDQAITDLIRARGKLTSSPRAYSGAGSSLLHAEDMVREAGVLVGTIWAERRRQRSVGMVQPEQGEAHCVVELSGGSLGEGGRKPILDLEGEALPPVVVAGGRRAESYLRAEPPGFGIQAVPAGEVHAPTLDRVSPVGEAR